MDKAMIETIVNNTNSVNLNDPVKKEQYRDFIYSQVRDIVSGKKEVTTNSLLITRLGLTRLIAADNGFGNAHVRAENRQNSDITASVNQNTGEIFWNLNSGYNNKIDNLLQN